MSSAPSLVAHVATPAPPRLVHRIAIGCWLLALLSGGWSLERIDPAYESLGVLAEPRYWITVALGAALALTLLARRTVGRRAPPATLAWAWCAAVLVLNAYLVVSAAWSPDAEPAAQRQGDLLFLMILYALTPLVFSTDPKADAEDLLLACYWVAVVYLIGGLLGPRTDQERMAAFGGGPNIFVRVMGTGMVAAIYHWGRTRSFIWLWTIPLLTYAAVLSGSRGGLVAIGLALTPFTVYTWRRTRVHPAALIPVAAATVLLFVVQARTVTKFVARRFVEQTIEKRYYSGRDRIFSDAWQMFREHPWFGAGLDGFRQTTRTGEDHAHNLVLQIAAEGGAVASALLAALLGVLAWHWCRRMPPPQRAVMALALIYLVSSMFSGGLYDTRLFWAFALVSLLPTGRALAG